MVAVRLCVAAERGRERERERRRLIALFFSIIHQCRQQRARTTERSGTSRRTGSTSCTPGGAVRGNDLTVYGYAAENTSN
jgi:hypothetical protein